MVVSENLYELPTEELELLLIDELTKFNSSNTTTSALYSCATEKYTFRLTSDNNIQVYKEDEILPCLFNVCVGVARTLQKYTIYSEEGIKTVLITLLKGLRLGVILTANTYLSKTNQLY